MSVIQTKVPSPEVSSKYKLVSSEALIGLAEELQFKLEGVQTTRVSVEREGFQKHLITLRDTLEENAEYAPQLIIINSHDGESALQVCLGLIRYACLNGLVFGTRFSEFKARHVGNVQENAKEAILNAVAALPEALQELKRLQSTQLNALQQIELAETLFKVRFPEAIEMDTRKLLSVKRVEDASNDAFTVFNRIQERLMRGGFEYRAKETTEFGATIERTKRAQRVKSPLSSIELNTRLWDALKGASL